MTTILLICDDEMRRAELHRTLISEFKVYSTDHFAAESLKYKLRKKDIILVESENLEDAKEKISIYSGNKKEKSKFHKVIKKLLLKVENNLNAKRIIQKTFRPQINY